MAVMQTIGLVVAVAAVTTLQSAQPSTRFVRDPALTRAMEAKIVAAARAREPSAVAELEAMFRQDFVAMVTPAFAEYGYSTDDVVDMTAVYWISAWEASNGRVGQKTDRAVAKGARDQLARAMRGTPNFAKLADAGKQDVADTMLLQGLMAEARMARATPAQRQTVSDQIHREAQLLLKVDMRALKLTAAGFAPRDAATVAKPGPTVAARGTTPAVAGLYFRAISGVGTVDFEPLVFFANGDYVEIDATALPDLNPAVAKARSPVRWGSWRQQGATFLLTNSKGRTFDYRLGSGNFFPAFSADQGPKLSGTYSSTAGGGTMAVGGNVATLAISKLTFAPDGSFTEGASAGGVAPNASIGNSRQAAGRWALSGTTLELNYTDGRKVRTSFLWGASGSPPRPDVDMAFIGGDVYVRK